MISIILTNQKKYIATILAVIIALSSVQFVFADDKPNVVYTEYSGGNSENGSGTQQSPYNFFENALNKVADGGTIYIGKKAFANVSDDSKPLVINKNVNIMAIDKSITPNLTTRSSGMVLGGNVTFDGIQLTFTNPYHNVLCANGYKLTMNNTRYDSSSNIIHIVGGSLYDLNQNSLSPTVGSESIITIKGNSSSFGNIYCGSINGSFDKPVSLILDNIGSKSIGEIYSSGALEGSYDPNQMLNPNYKPGNPTANETSYPVNSNVEINLDNSPISHINGKINSNKKASVIIKTEYPTEYNMDNIDNLKIEKGTVALTSLNNDVSIEIKDEATLNVSSLENLEINNFIGGGSIVLNKDFPITIKGNLSGTTDFKFSGGSLNNSGMGYYDYMYIDTSTATGDGNFTFKHPYSTQSSMNIVKRSDGKWYTTAQPEDDTPAIKTFGILSTSQNIEISKDEINQNNADIEINVEFENDVPWDIGMIPLTYKVEHNGISSGLIQSTESTESENYYECIINDFNMRFEPVYDTISISNRLNYLESFENEIETGIYNIEIIVPTNKGDVSGFVRLAVTGDDKETPPEIVLPTVNQITSGTKLSDISLSGDWKWIDDNITPNIGSNQYQIYLDVDDANYDYTNVDGYDSANHRVVRTITVTVIKPTGSVPDTPVLGNITYNSKSTLADINLYSGWNWLDSSQSLSVGSNQYQIYINVDDNNLDFSSVDGYDSANHRVVRNITVTVIKPAGSVPTIPTLGDIVFGSKLSDISLSKDWNWLYDDNITADTVPALGSNQYKIYTNVDDNNYDFSNVDGYDQTNHRVVRNITFNVIDNSPKPEPEPKPTGSVPTIPTLGDIVFGSKSSLADIELSDGWHWIDDSQSLSVGSNQYQIYINVDDNNYDFSNIDGYDQTNHRVIRTITVTVIENSSKPEPEPKPEILIGDANGNGTLELDDIIELMKKVFNSDYEIGLSKTTQDWFKYVDMDNDDKLTATDVALLFKLIQKI